MNFLKMIGDAQKKKAIVDVRSGDTVRVTQKIKEGEKFRMQVFEGTVIRTDRKDSHSAMITVRKVASGVGVEKSFLMHSPLVEKVEVVRRGKVRRNNLSYLRERSGKSARLTNKAFDRVAVNSLEEVAEEKEIIAETKEVSEKEVVAEATPEEEVKEVIAEEKKNSETVAEKDNAKGSAEPAE